jgi:hypothetical protein
MLAQSSVGSGLNLSLILPLKNVDHPIPVLSFFPSFSISDVL